MPRLPAAGAGRKADRVIVTTFPGSPALWAGSFTGLNKLMSAELIHSLLTEND
jgi:hypothetical protein